ncbi:MAG TPA: hypothetical protein VKM93_07650 [Terriglobia bacterium]|nr:hypothetical protein [Terriglobia bacterium]
MVLRYPVIAQLSLLFDGVTLPFQLSDNVSEIVFGPVGLWRPAHHQDELHRASRKFHGHIQSQPPVRSHLTFSLHDLHRTLSPRSPTDSRLD